MIFWAGKSSDDYRVIVEKYPSVILGARKLDLSLIHISEPTRPY